ncbi:MAG: YlbD family protein [Bacillota bacterium]|nr:YlbD family protein [Bacillota bacterium]
MGQKKLHPSVVEFKEFVRNNPKIIQEVRKGNATWQELYEDWYLLGEDDERWEKLGQQKEAVEETMEDDKKTDWMSTLTGMLKKMDPNQMQHHINNLSQAIGAIQGLLTQFQGTTSQPPQTRELEGPKNPFSFRKD